MLNKLSHPDNDSSQAMNPNLNLNNLFDFLGVQSPKVVIQTSNTKHQTQKNQTVKKLE